MIKLWKKWFVFNYIAEAGKLPDSSPLPCPHPGLGIRSFAQSLISLKSNEQLWAIRSDRSRQMSDCERIAQVARDKWAIRSKNFG